MKSGMWWPCCSSAATGKTIGVSTLKAFTCGQLMSVSCMRSFFSASDQVVHFQVRDSFDDAVRFAEPISGVRVRHGNAVEACGLCGANALDAVLDRDALLLKQTSRLDSRGIAQRRIGREKQIRRRLGSGDLVGGVDGEEVFPQARYSVVS